MGRIKQKDKINNEIYSWSYKISKQGYPLPRDGNQLSRKKDKDKALKEFRITQSMEDYQNTLK